MDWKFTGSKPVYQQIMTHLQRAVMTGEYPPGSRIPSVRDLAAQARVNPNTMQRALAELEQQGLLVTHGTAGRCVTEAADVLQQMRDAALAAVAQECAARFRALGVDLSTAAALLLAVQEKED